ncbi:MAG: hypothetical protein ACBZ72_04295 [Candidatus Bathyarchaeia archaeon]
MEKKDKNSQPKKPLSHNALRLTFEYDRDKIRLVNRHSVNMIVPPPTTTPLTEKHSGFWIEIKDSEGKVLFSRVEYNPIQYDTEIFLGTANKNIVRRPILHPQGTFVLLVPDLPEAESIDLVSSPLDAKRAHEPAKKLASFALKEKRQKGDTP